MRIDQTILVNKSITLNRLQTPEGTWKCHSTAFGWFSSPLFANAIDIDLKTVLMCDVNVVLISMHGLN